MGVERRTGREVEGVRDRAAENTPAGVSERATQAGEIRARWAWAEPTVWTERMLAALEQGVKGGKTIYAGPMPTLRDMDCFPWPRPMQKPANPLAGKPPTGEPYAGDPPVRFGGRGGRQRLSLPLSGFGGGSVPGSLLAQTCRALQSYLLCALNPQSDGSGTGLKPGPRPSPG